jgi:hypothetical protein
MKIAYLDFNEDDFFEDYSEQPQRYGGGRVFASIAKEKIPNFYLFANPRSFDNLAPSENSQHCIGLSSEQRRAIREGKPIKDIIQDADTFDLFVHHQARYAINTEGLKAKSCCWAVGYGEIIHRGNPHVLLYNNYQSPFFQGAPQVHKIVIGKPIPAFQEYQKEPFIFQCTRHTKIFGSMEVAKFCRRHQIPVYFAGPIDKDYPLLEIVDDKHVFYLGVISEQEKISWLKRARLTTYMHSWQTPFNLSAIESLAYGTPIITSPSGFWPSLVNGSNGRMITTEEELFEAFRVNFSQKDCYDSALPYSQDKMLESFQKAFQTIYEAG